MSHFNGVAKDGNDSREVQCALAEQSEVMKGLKGL